MVDVVSGEELGTIRLRFGFSRYLEMYAGHVGYAVHANHRGHRYASRAVRLLIPLARGTETESALGHMRSGKSCLAPQPGIGGSQGSSKS